jgi:hypothetical protein
MGFLPNSLDERQAASNLPRPQATLQRRVSHVLDLDERNLPPGKQHRPTVDTNMLLFRQ